MKLQKRVSLTETDEGAVLLNERRESIGSLTVLARAPFANCWPATQLKGSGETGQLTTRWSSTKSQDILRILSSNFERRSWLWSDSAGSPSRTTPVGPAPSNHSRGDCDRGAFRGIRRVLTTLRKGSRPAHYSETLVDRDDVVSASLTCAGEGCLPRSLAVCFLGRIHGRWPTWCTGVRMEPFRAHAWVEADGQPVGELHSMDAYAVTMRI